MLNRLVWFFTLVIGVIVGFVIWIVMSTPNVEAIRGCLQTSLYQVWLCEDSHNPNYRHLKEISPYLKNLVLISEDASFYGHNGFDWDELKNSFERNLSVGRAARGGSTITQQLAKNVFLNSEKTIARKIREALLTVQIESILTKDKIFEKYLNVIEWGPQIYGVEAAAQHYFNKPASALNLLEAAYLTFLIPNPKGYSKSFARGLTPYGRFRITDLCFRLYKTKRITEDQYLAARQSLDFFPWRDLPTEYLARLNAGSAQSDIHDAIDEKTINAPSPNETPPTFQGDEGLENLPQEEVDPADKPLVTPDETPEPSAPEQWPAPVNTEQKEN